MDSFWSKSMVIFMVVPCEGVQCMRWCSVEFVKRLAGSCLALCMCTRCEILRAPIHVHVKCLGGARVDKNLVADQRWCQNLGASSL